MPFFFPYLWIWKTICPPARSPLMLRRTVKRPFYGPYCHYDTRGRESCSSVTAEFLARLAILRTERKNENPFFPNWFMVYGYCAAGPGSSWTPSSVPFEFGAILPRPQRTAFHSMFPHLFGILWLSSPRLSLPLIQLLPQSKNRGQGALRQFCRSRRGRTFARSLIGGCAIDRNDLACM